MSRWSHRSWTRSVLQRKSSVSAVRLKADKAVVVDGASAVVALAGRAVKNKTGRTLGDLFKTRSHDCG